MRREEGGDGHLWRGGETLDDLARHALGHNRDPEAAELAHRHAWDRMEKVLTDEKALDAWQVPARAEEVSRPQREQARSDRIGNLCAAAPTPALAPVCR